jgi:hypothetical protein
MNKLIILISVLILYGIYSKSTNRMAKLNHQVDSLALELRGINQKVANIEAEKGWSDLLSALENVAFLTPGAAGYSVIQSDLGKITVSLDNVQAYANGSRVTLRFGNITSATINGAKAKLEWGRIDDKGNADNKTSKYREVEFSKPLLSGKWTSVNVVLEGVPPSELGFVRIKEMTHSGIRLGTEYGY